MATCTINKHLRQLGTGALSAGAVTVTSWTAGAGVLAPMVGRNIWITMTSGAAAGRTFCTKVMAESAGVSLTLRDPSPFPT